MGLVGFSIVVALLAGRKDVQLQAAGGAPPHSGVHVGRVEPLGTGAEILAHGKWRTLSEDGAIATGESVRTNDSSSAVIDVAWSVLILGPSSSFRFLPSRVLVGRLEEGRVEERATAADIVRLQTPEGAISGQGHVIVRRQNKRTAVSVVSGIFRVQNGKGGVEVSGGQGTLMESDRGPTPVAVLPTAPSASGPAGEVVYAVRGTPATMQWASPSPRHHVQVVTEPGGHVVADSEGSATSFATSPPLGLYRWRVAAIDASGLEGQSSADGFICVVDRY